MAINAFRKGREFEQWVRKELSKRFDKYGGKARRTVRSGALGDDIQSEQGDAYHQALPFMFEAKRSERIPLYEYWDQTTTECKNIDKTPVLVVRSNDKPALVVMDFHAWLDLVDFAMASNLLQVGKKPIARTDQTKKVKLSVAETADLPFSKAKQIARSRKNKS